MPKGELENRDRDESADLSNIPLAGGNLGELPEDLASERGDLDGYATRAAQNMVPDMASAQRSRVDAADTGLGSPKLDYSVRSIYDSRPINHREFNLWFDAFADPEQFVEFDQFFRCFFVPAGYVCVLREVTCLVQPPTFELLNYDGSISIMVNGSIVDPMEVEVGPDVGGGNIAQTAIRWRDGEPTKTFILADEGDAIGASVTIADGSVEYDDVNFFQIGFYGQFLLKTGVPAQFQAANEAGRARTAVTTGKNDLALQSSDSVMARRRRKIPFPNVPILRK